MYKLLKQSKDFANNIYYQSALNSSKKNNDNLNTNDNRHKNAIIINDVIKKGNISINLYLINFKHIEQPELDKNYKPLPLREKNIYEYGTVITFEDVSGEYAIENAFSGIEDTKELAEIKYKNLKEEMCKMTEKEIMNKLEKHILDELNNK